VSVDMNWGWGGEPPTIPTLNVKMSRTRDAKTRLCPVVGGACTRRRCDIDRRGLFSLTN